MIQFNLRAFLIQFYGDSNLIGANPIGGRHQFSLRGGGLFQLEGGINLIQRRVNPLRERIQLNLRAGPI